MGQTGTNALDALQGEDLRLVSQPAERCREENAVMVAFLGQAETTIKDILEGVRSVRLPVRLRAIEQSAEALIAKQTVPVHHPPSPLGLGQPR